MNKIEFGLILSAMATYAKERAAIRNQSLGKENTELLFAIGHTLAIGAERALELTKEEQK